jgi:hypothetical protein
MGSIARSTAAVSSFRSDSGAALGLFFFGVFLADDNGIARVSIWHQPVQCWAGTKGFSLAM